MIQDDDQGIENQFIDPFAVVSTEAYPFPVEDYIPPEPEVVIPNPDSAIVPSISDADIPKLNENGTVEAANALKVTTDDAVHVEASTFTDTPANPLDQPAENAVRVSFEEGEESEVDNDIEVLDEIVSIHRQLKEIGGISKDDVVAFEAYFPGSITGKVPLNRFSSVATPMGLQPSLESIVDQIVNIVKTIVSWIIRQVKKILDWILACFDESQVDNLFTVKNKWAVIEGTAKRIDSTGNGTLFKQKYSRYPHTAKSSTTHHFIQLHANYVMSRVFSNFNVGMLMVQKGSASTEAKALVNRMSQLRNYITGGVNNFKVGRPVNDIDKSVAGEALSAENHVEHIARLKANFQELASPMIKEFKNAITVKDVRATIANDMKTVGDGMVKLRKDIDALDELVAGSVDKGKYDVDGLRKVKEGMRILVSLTLELDVYLTYFTKYCTAAMVVVNDCNRIVLSLRLP